MIETGKVKIELTLRDHAQLWWMSQGHIIPPRNTSQHDEMYETWVSWAFSDFV